MLSRGGRILVATCLAGVALTACGLFDFSKKDRREFLDECVTKGADRAASEAATVALEKHACRGLVGCEDWLGRTKGICVKQGSGGGSSRSSRRTRSGTTRASSRAVRRRATPSVSR